MLVPTTTLTVLQYQQLLLVGKIVSRNSPLHSPLRRKRRDSSLSISVMLCPSKMVHSTYRYCIGAFDRESGTMTLHRAQQFLLKPHIPGILYIHSITCLVKVVICCAGKTDIGVDDSAAAEQQTPSKTDYRKSVDKMVNLFGSEKQKRAFSAAKRNVVDEGELDAALATAVSHIKKEVEDVASGMILLYGLRTILLVISSHIGYDD